MQIFQVIHTSNYNLTPFYNAFMDMRFGEKNLPPISYFLNILTIVQEHIKSNG